MGSNDSCTPSTPKGKKQLRVLLIPFLATSHIQPFTELAIRLAGAANNNGVAVEVTVAVTPASESIVQRLLAREGDTSSVKIATYPFPVVDGTPENCGKATTPDETSRILSACTSEALMRPAQETLIREQSPDAIITDTTFLWLTAMANDLGLPCVRFSVIGAFTVVAMNHLGNVAAKEIEDLADDGAVVVPGFPPEPEIRPIPKTELPEHMRAPGYASTVHPYYLSLQAECFGFAFNTSPELEKEYCEMYRREGYAKRAYFLGPVALLPPSPASSPPGPDEMMDWLDSKADRSVVYVSFGSMAHVKDAQLDELALGLEEAAASGVLAAFLWVVRGNDHWSPPEGWVERVRDRGIILRSWAPQTAILGHRAVGAFVMQCGWNSILETVAAGVPVLTWPYSHDQFITERLLTDVLRIGEPLWPEGPGRVRSGRYEEHHLVPAQDVARSLTTFMRPGGPGDAARTKINDLRTAMNEQGASQHRDRELHRLLDDLLMEAEAKSAKQHTT